MLKVYSHKVLSYGLKLFYPMKSFIIIHLTK